MAQLSARVIAAGRLWLRRHGYGWTIRAYQTPSHISPRSERHIAHMARGSFGATSADPTVVRGRKHPGELLDGTLGALFGDAERPVAARCCAFDVAIGIPAVDGVGDVGHGLPFYPLSKRKPLSPDSSM